MEIWSWAFQFVDSSCSTCSLKTRQTKTPQRRISPNDLGGIQWQSVCFPARWSSKLHASTKAQRSSHSYLDPCMDHWWGRTGFVQQRTAGVMKVGLNADQCRKTEASTKQTFGSSAALHLHALVPRARSSRWHEYEVFIVMSKLLKISNDSFLQQLSVEHDFIPKAFQSSLIGRRTLSGAADSLKSHIEEQKQQSSEEGGFCPSEECLSPTAGQRWWY